MFIHIIPGPKEPEAQLNEMNPYLHPIIDEFLDLWSGVAFSQTTDFPYSQLILCAIILISYMLVNQIGSSRFSIIFHTVNFLMHLVTACKLITFTPTTTPTTCKFTEKEIRIHSILKHPHILKFLNAIVVKTKHAHLYMLGIYMLMELAGGSDDDDTFLFILKAYFTHDLHVLSPAVCNGSGNYGHSN
ncbi:hypothetical protein H2248_004050 [Termitomyces sp. 'cryptogamus']|nr:hypothetical protein H2248_004050 [Termitomyces sp. 'cryptogamus']